MISFSDLTTKAQTLSGDSTAATLTQLKQDINTGYKRFNSSCARYFTRKQKFADIVASQQYYQVPVDAIRVEQVVIAVSSSYSIPLQQVRDEEEWRWLNSQTTYTSNWPSHYWVNGSLQIGIYPTPSAALSQGLRYVYQPQDVDLSKADYTTGTVTIANGATVVTGVTTVWTSASHKGMFLQVTDGSDGNFYEIDTVTSNTTLNLITPYAGPSVTSVAYRLAQLSFLPEEYTDIPVDYAMMRFFESRNNPNRAKYHQQNFKQAIDEATAQYASSSTSSVITGNEPAWNPWLIPPLVGN